MSLSFAQAKHKSDILRMMKDFKTASPYAHVHSDPEKMSQLVDNMTNASRKEAVVIVYEHKGKAVGLIAGQIGEMLFNRDTVASELMWWVDPEHRNSGAAVRLLSAFEEWARRNGCSMIQMVMVETEQADGVKRLYTKKNYRTTEQAYIKELN